VFWLAAVGIGASVMRSEFDEVFDSALKETSARLLPLLVEDLFRRAPGGLPRRIGFAGAEGDEYLTYQLRDSSGKVCFFTRTAPSLFLSMFRSSKAMPTRRPTASIPRRPSADRCFFRSPIPSNIAAKQWPKAWARYSSPWRF
jgi:hypothetical protein